LLPVLHKKLLSQGGTWAMEETIRFWW